MPDLLAHALLAYVLARLLSWRIDWVTTPYVTAAMAGAFIPDIQKVKLLVPDWRVEALLGLPFDWFGWATLGGAVLSVLIGVAVVSPRVRWRAGAALSLGAASHLLADALLRSPSGRSFDVLWPLSRWHPPTPGLYLSTEPTPSVVVGAVALVVWVAHRRRERREA